MKRVLSAGALLVAALSSARAYSQAPGDDARAEVLFTAAKQLRDGGQLAQACPLFAESQRLAPGVGITLHLADCYERMGKTASAWTQFREAEKLARDRGDTKRAEVAHARATMLEPELGQLTVATGAAHDGWQVAVDGAPLSVDRLNAALAVDPGDHVVTVAVPGQATRTLHAHIDKAHLVARLRIDEPEAAAVAPAPVEAVAPPPSEPSAPEPPPPPSGGNTRLWVGIGLVSAGVIGAGLGTAFLVKRNNAMNSGTICDPPYTDNADLTAATIAYAAGGVALASALVVYLTAPHKTGVGVTVAPTFVSSGGAGALVRGQF